MAMALCDITNQRPKRKLPQWIVESTKHIPEKEEDDLNPKMELAQAVMHSLVHESFEDGLSNAFLETINEEVSEDDIVDIVRKPVCDMDADELYDALKDAIALMD